MTRIMVSTAPSSSRKRRYSVSRVSGPSAMETHSRSCRISLSGGKRSYSTTECSNGLSSASSSAAASSSPSVKYPASPRSGASIPARAPIAGRRFRSGAFGFHFSGRPRLPRHDLYQANQAAHAETR
ncbi:hypothetical protein [Saltwater crocodilepox virus]|nr:hypothetical protein [Saltwater crocodilepox virus]AVD69363.1 hypothetical protein [Saltwater crocodilepox virus]QGT46465.1 ORF026 [Saltwater crocodilepox virus]QGT46681.1 ORF026 [Saltwater crocodilepox virus]QGT46898.1 ORF026 [Saltwater crocodilepox virus]